MSSLRGSFDPLTGIIVRIGIAKPNSFPSQQTGPVPYIVKVKALNHQRGYPRGLPAARPN